MKLDTACERIGVFNPYKNPPRLIDAFIDRLIELAAGAEPADRRFGNLVDISMKVGVELTGFHGMLLRRTAKRMELTYGPGWSGPRGKRRRKLCYDVAVQALASVKGDYRGRYQ